MLISKAQRSNKQQEAPATSFQAQNFHTELRLFDLLLFGKAIYGLENEGSAI